MNESLQDGSPPAESNGSALVLIPEVIEAEGTEQVASLADEQRVEGRQESMSRKVIGLALRDVELFLDDKNEPWGIVRAGGVLRTLPLRSRAFHQWLDSRVYGEFNWLPGESTTRGAVRLLCAEAVNRAVTRAVHTRFARAEKALWLDLADNEGKVVRVDATGWVITDADAGLPVLFRGVGHQMPLPLPERPGSPVGILRFINVRNSSDRILLLTWMACALIADIPRPILMLHGPQGSGKSTCAKMIRACLDPSSAPTLNLPTKEDELAQILSGHAVPLFDNLTSISKSQGDMLCTAVTGGGFTKRELYSNSDDVVFSFRRPILMTGITVPSAQPDLLDRCVMIEVERLSDGERKTEEQLWADFHAAAPRILGGLLNLVSSAMKNVDSVKLDGLPRMADFGRWGAAVAVALGLSAEDFRRAYEENVERQTTEILEANPLAEALLKARPTFGSFQGTYGELFDYLEGVRPEGRRPRGWPTNSAQLSKELTRIAHLLRQKGVIVERGERTELGRLVTVTWENVV